MPGPAPDENFEPTGDDILMTEGDMGPKTFVDALRDAAQVGIDAVNEGLLPDEGVDAPKPISSMGPPTFFHVDYTAGVVPPVKPVISETPETTAETVVTPATGTSVLICYVLCYVMLDSDFSPSSIHEFVWRLRYHVS